MLHVAGGYEHVRRLAQVLVIGSRGAGKSTLVRAALNDAADGAAYEAKSKRNGGRYCKPRRNLQMECRRGRLRGASVGKQSSL